MADVVVQIEQGAESSKSNCVLLLLRTIFHFACFGAWCVVASWGGYIWSTIDETKSKQPLLKDMKMLTPAFLTNWNYVFQTIFLGLSLGHDILEWADKQDTKLGTKARYWKNVIFNSVVLPYTLFVTSMFWCIYAIDRELVFPKIYDEVVPWWFNHCVHTNITIMVIIETLLQPRRHPTDVRMETILHAVIAISYAIVYYTIYYFTRRWLYQVFGVMNWWQVCLFQLLIWSSCYFFYRMQFPISRLIHGSEDAYRESTEVKHVNAAVNGEANGNNHANGNTIVDGTEYNNGKATEEKTPAVSNNGLSLKYRSTKYQFENSHL